MRHSPSKHTSGGTGKKGRSGNESTENRSDNQEAPIRQASDVQKSNDEHIDQDFPGYPHHPSHDRTIHNGSAGAFDATEHSHDEEDDDLD